MKSEETKKLCQICKESPFKYRCPSCYLFYCSLPCFKSHKVNVCGLETEKRKKQSGNPDKVKEEEDISGEDDNSEDEDRLSPSDLENLGNCDMIKSMLKNKDIREMIMNVDGAQDPEMALRTAMKEPIFLEFADQCLTVVEQKQEGTG